MRVIKSSGEIEEFNKKKIYKTIKEAGGSKKLANEAVKAVLKNYCENFTTNDILKILLEFLKQEPGVSEKYNLKQAIMQFGPTGFPFEKYFAKILEYHGYKTKVGRKLNGKNILHEVDIIAEGEKKFMVECKYHNKTGTITRLHPAMYTYARFLDLDKYNFNNPWLVTNTKCSLDARKYAKGVKLKITGWNYPEKKSLQELIEKKGLYPVTILKNITGKLKENLFLNNILTLKDFKNFSEKDLEEKLKLSEKQILELLKNVNEILM